MKTPRPLPSVPPVAGQTLDAQLHLLDRQVLPGDGRNGGQRAGCFHAPAPVTIISGMAASEATRITTR